MGCHVTKQYLETSWNQFNVVIRMNEIAEAKSSFVFYQEWYRYRPAADISAGLEIARDIDHQVFISVSFESSFRRPHDECFYITSDFRHLLFQKQCGAGEEAAPAQAADPVGGGALPAGGRQDGAGEGVQETGQGQAHYVRCQICPWHFMTEDGRDNGLWVEQCSLDWYNIEGPKVTLIPLSFWTLSWFVFLLYYENQSSLMAASPFGGHSI